MVRFFKMVLAAGLSFSAVSSFACTSVIISGGKSGSGRPVMMKHRDTGTLDNRMEWFKGEKYAFIGLVNSDWAEKPTAVAPFPFAEVWAGSNTAGFCIMNTATYDIKDDDVPDSLMDREGFFMYRALEICANIADFENYLDTLSRPMGVEANFGVIDAHGGAAYYEVNNSRWFKFDVNADREGWRVVTNFTQHGRKEDRKGVDRYNKACSLMAREATPSSLAIWKDHTWLINNISRSGTPILRDISSACIVFEGVAPGENPQHTVVWAAVGWPAATVYVPLLPFCGNLIPAYLSGNAGTGHSLFCDNSLKWKAAGTDVSAAVRKTEGMIDSRFTSLYLRWKGGKISDYHFIQGYASLLDRIGKEYGRNVAHLPKND